MKLLNIDQMAEKLDLSKETIYQWACRKKIPYIKLGGKLRFDEPTIDAWLKTKKVETFKA